MTPVRARPLFILLAGLVCLTATGAPAHATPPESGKSISFRLTSAPATLDWTLAHTSHETYVIMNLMEGLVRQGKGLEPEPALAEKWDILDEGKRYVFHIRKEAKWSDGKALRAQDFVDSWIRLLAPDTKSSYASFLFDVENAEAFHRGKIRNAERVGVKALGPHRLEVRLHRPVPYFLFMPTFWVTFPIRQDLISRHGNAWTEPGKIATVGPFLLEKWDHKQSIILKKNPHYHEADSVEIDRVTALIVPNDAEARELFRKGKIDFLQDATTNDLLATKLSDTRPAAQRVKIGQYPYLATYYLAFNVNHGPMRDVNVRRAIALGIERAGIPGVLQSGQIPAFGWIPPGMEGHSSENILEGSLYDARAALARAGYTEARGLPKLVIWMEPVDGGQRLADYIRRSLREKLGVEVEIQTGDAAQYQAARKKGKADMYVGHWGADFPDPANFYEVFAPGSSSNFLRWKNEDYARSLDAARETRDMKKRLRAYSRAEEILLKKDVVLMPLFYKQTVVLLSEQLEQFTISPMNYLFLKDVRLKAK